MCERDAKGVSSIFKIRVLEEDNGSGQEKEEEEEQQHPLQQDHVDVTNFLHLLNRSVTPPLPPDS